jgi:hypothetical protein
MDNGLNYSKKERIIKSEILLKVFDRYELLFNLCANAKMRSLSDKSDNYMRKLGLDIVGKKKIKKKRNSLINEYFDVLQKDLEDSAVLNLVAVFESIAFNNIPSVVDKSKKKLSSHYIQSDPFSSSVKSFVKSTQDIKNISTIVDILSGNIPISLENDLKKIIDYRNRIAHGKRFGSTSDLSVRATIEKLDEVLESVIKA